jgi:hypothetical protein
MVKGVAFGHGVYFAVNSQYSQRYAVQSSNNQRKMIRARVLVGESCIGNSSMKVAPPKPNGEPFDSTNNDSNTIFVCYRDCQCYPDYIITFT